MILSEIFSNRTVLQANKPIRLYGTGSGFIRASIAGNEASFSQTEDKKWILELPALDYGGPYELRVETDRETKILTDVMLGDVYLLAGQSNLQFTLAESGDPEETQESNPLLRTFMLNRPENPQGDFFKPESGWQCADARTLFAWSAIGYYMAKERHRQTGHAVGLVTCYQGASTIESWLPEEIALLPAFALPAEAKLIDHHHPPYAAWSPAGALYRFSFERLIPFSFGAVVWYQGESDSTPEEAAIYEAELEALAARWREDLRDETLLFLIVQIADNDERRDEGWRGIQRAQERAAAALPHAKLVPCRDICESNHIHPATKRYLGARLAAAADT